MNYYLLFALHWHFRAVEMIFKQKQILSNFLFKLKMVINISHNLHLSAKNAFGQGTLTEYMYNDGSEV